MLVQLAQKAVIIRDGHVLVVQRSSADPLNPLRWEIPGGRMAANETVDDHIAREVREEVSLTVRPCEPLALWSWRLGPEPDATQVVAIARRCVLAGDTRQEPSTQAAPPEDCILGCRWVAADELAALDLIPNARQATLDAVTRALQHPHDETEKLVRDRIPEIMRAAGATPEVRAASSAEYPMLLRRKLLEEATEVSTSVDGRATMGELADLVEVVYALAGAIGHTPGDLDQERARRARDRGGFRRAVVLTIGPP